MNMTRGAAESWRVEISEDELMQIFGVTVAVGRKETGSTVVWLTRVPNGPRLWIYRDGSVVTWVTAAAGPSDPVIAIPFPETFLGPLAFAAGEGESVTVTCNVMDGTIVGHTPTRTIATDMPTDVKFAPLDLPYQRQDESRHLNPAVATVAISDLNYLATLSHDIPRGLHLAGGPRDEEKLHPYVSIAIGNGSMTWTTDWRRYGMGRTTATIPAVTTGSVAAMFYPYQAARILQSKDPDQDVRMFIDGSDADFVYIVGNDWGIRIKKEFEEVVRWRRSLVDAIENSGREMAPESVGAPPNRVAFMVDDALCFAKIQVSEDGASETIRFTAVVAEHVQPTLEVLTRVTELNLEIVGTKVALRDGQVRIECEFPATELPEIEPHLSAFTTAVAKVGPRLDFLPIFAADSADQ